MDIRAIQLFGLSMKRLLLDITPFNNQSAGVLENQRYFPTFVNLKV